MGREANVGQEPVLSVLKSNRSAPGKSAVLDLTSVLQIADIGSMERTPRQLESENRAARLTGSNPANSITLIIRARRLSQFGGRAESRRVWSLRCDFGG